MRYRPTPRRRGRLAVIPDGVPEQKRMLPRDFGEHETDAQRYRDTVELLNRVADFHAAHPKWPAARRWAAVERRFGRWARARRLSCKPGTLREYARRVDPYRGCFDGNMDRRGRRREPRGSRFSGAAWKLFYRVLHNRSTESVKEAWERVQTRAKRAGWTWCSLRLAQGMVPGWRKSRRSKGGAS